MYESFYGFSAKPFQLKPDPLFFYGSKGHKRAMGYLEYGVAQGEGFIVITGDVGAGKTTLVRSLFRKLPANEIVAAQIVNTQVTADDIVRQVAAAFGLPFQGVSKAGLLSSLEQFLRQCERQGKRALLVVDEAQNLTPGAIEELRMLSNFQSDERALLQTFLVGQPEFRSLLLGLGMKQLLQRVIATYHLGPLDLEETTAYIQHRLRTVGWAEDPVIEQPSYGAIYAYTGGIPRKINTLCDRLFLLGYLEDLHRFGAKEVEKVIADINEELMPTALASEELPAAAIAVAAPDNGPHLDEINTRLERMERTMTSLLGTIKNVLFSTTKTTAENP
ncbi:putative secretion ATPase, PEP-CTERM locus subfamily [Noviherbaspirillum humi]|uniref:Putative secretion ATPase, PEP-CTERM locus subfamily n=1 Tax=Noviherbaspirillum humi TaxID=1688639 RepID=A0A239HJ04_9BURK|nr:XrtA/PEP-CTERM system-associated ATPase [Noviherbaspirillum humi]SNS81406.1 putative secretion ATPase, PEP-CTERM locus subfamily [Noviherbaspirillum humi]